MTADEKKAMLDAIDKAEREALQAAQAQPASPSSSVVAEPIIYKMAARIREAVRAIDTTDLPMVEHSS